MSTLSGSTAAEFESGEIVRVTKEFYSIALEPRTPRDEWEWVYARFHRESFAGWSEIEFNGKMVNRGPLEVRPLDAVERLAIIGRCRDCLVGTRCIHHNSNGPALTYWTSASDSSASTTTWNMPVPDATSALSEPDERLPNPRRALTARERARRSARAALAKRSRRRNR